jgi:outer membrane immunogenic protein
MKFSKIVAGTMVALTIFDTVPVWAADLPLRAYKAPPMADLAYSWSRCYIGVEAGGAWGSSKNVASNAPAASPTPVATTTTVTTNTAATTSNTTAATTNTLAATFNNTTTSTKTIVATTGGNPPPLWKATNWQPSWNGSHSATTAWSDHVWQPTWHTNHTPSTSTTTTTNTTTTNATITSRNTTTTNTNLTDIKTTTTATTTTTPAATTTVMPITTAFDNMSGGLAGATFGCNYQVNAFVFGIENDISWTNGSAKSQLGQTSEKWLDTLRGRIGYAFDRTLFYGTGGVAFAGTSTTICNTTPGLCVSNSQTRTGWVVGAGIEYAISQELSLKFEYLHADFGAGKSVTTQVAQGAVTTQNIKLTDDLVRVGLNWGFTSIPSF